MTGVLAVTGGFAAGIAVSVLAARAMSRPPQHRQPLISTADTAAELKVDRSTLTRMVQAGKIRPAIRGEGLRGAMFFYASEVKRAKGRIAGEAAS